MTLFSLNDTDCGLTCTTGAGKTEQEDGRNKTLFISSQFLFLSPFLAYPFRTAAILKRANKIKTTNGRTETEVSIISHRPVTRSDLKQERSFFRGSVSTFLQLVV